MCPFVSKKGYFCPKVKLHTFLSQNFDLRTSEAHFIKESAVRGTAATCDSLVGTATGTAAVLTLFLAARAGSELEGAAAV